MAQEFPCYLRADRRRLLRAKSQQAYALERDTIFFGGPVDYDKKLTDLDAQAVELQAAVDDEHAESLRCREKNSGNRR